MLDYETRLAIIAARAWENWTNNGLDLDDETRFQTSRTAQDVACNAFGDGYTDEEWLSATLAALNKATGRA
jgi:hypothetical protein